MLGSHDDVLVVREDKDRGSGRVLNRFQNIIGGRVHGLTAGDDVVSAQFEEEIGHAVARAHGDDTIFLLRFRIDLFFRRRGFHIFEFFLDLIKIIGGLGLFAGFELLGLGDHVLDFGQLERAVFLALIQGVARHVGMDMDLENLIVVTDDKGVADTGEIFSQRIEIDIGIILSNNIDGVKRKGNGLRQDVTLVRENVRFGVVALADITGCDLPAK